MRNTADGLLRDTGHGANTAIFSLVNAVLYRPRHVAAPDRLVEIYQPVITSQTMTQYLEASLQASRAAASGLGALSALGVGLAGLGLYAVVAFAVARRVREIGIRMALGARGRQVVWSVARDVAALVGIGTTVGLALSLLATLAVRGAVAPAPGIAVYRPAADPVAFAAIAAFMAGVGLVAAFVPARRAALTDPLAALRRD